MSCIPINDFSLITLCDASRAGKLYSIVPANGDGDFDVTRATVSGVRRVNKLGQYEAVAANVPIINFDIITGEFLGLRIRGNFVNIWRNSEPTALGSGTSSNVTFAANDWNLGLEGKVIFGDNSVARLYRNTINQSNSGGFTVAFIARRDDLQKPIVRGAVNPLTDYNLLFVSGGSGMDPDVGVARFELDLGNGFWFICLSGIPSTPQSTLFSGFQTDAISNNANVSRLNNTIEISAITWIHGAALTLSPYDYVATFGTAITRDADEIVRTGASALIGQTEGAINLTAQLRTSGVDQTAIELYEDTDNYINIRKNTSNEIVATLVVAGATVGTVTSAVQTAGEKVISLTYQTGTCTLTVNGVDTTATATGVPACSAIRLGARQNNTEYWNSHVKVTALKTSI